MKKVTLFLIIVAVGLSCNKNEISENTNFQLEGFNNTRDNIQSNYISEPEFVFNALNPMDFAGEFHNESMYYISEQTNLEIQPNAGFYFQLMNNILTEYDLNSGFLLENSEQYKIELNNLNNFSLNNDFIGYYEDLKLRNTITTLQFGYFTRLVQEVNNISQYLSIKNGNMLEAYKLFNNKIKIIETQIINDDRFTTSIEKNLVLSIASIYRFSMYNYYDILNNPNNLIANILSNAGFELDNPQEGDIQAMAILGANWKRVGNADGGGAAAGLAVLGVSLIASGGTSIVAAIELVGGGAAGASVYELWDQVANGPAWICWLCPSWIMY